MGAEAYRRMKRHLRFLVVRAGVAGAYFLWFQDAAPAGRSCGAPPVRFAGRSSASPSLTGARGLGTD